MISYYMANKIQNNIFLGENILLPTDFYLGFSTSSPNADGTNVIEPSTPDYERIRLRRADEVFAQSENGVVRNETALYSVNTTSSWGELTHYCVFDAQYNGNLLFYGELSRPRIVDADMMLVLPIGAISFELGNTN